MKQPPHDAGFTLPELLVALALSSLVLAGALTMVSTAGATLRARDATSDMQERARFALSRLEDDIQMAGFYGLTARGADFAFLQSGNVAGALPPGLLRQAAAPVPWLATSAHACGENFAIDLALPVQVDDDTFALGRNRSASCSARGGARAGADTLTLRHAAADTATPDPGRVQLLADATDRTRRWLLTDGVLPPGAVMTEDSLQLHDLETTVFYVSNDSDGASGVPSLRRKDLTRIAGSAAFFDTEVISGIEDLQVELHTAHGIHMGSTLPAAEPVTAVTVWLRVRSTVREAGHVDDRSYTYASHTATPTPDEQPFRRLLVSRTIALPNSHAH